MGIAFGAGTTTGRAFAIGPDVLSISDFAVFLAFISPSETQQPKLIDTTGAQMPIEFLLEPTKQILRSGPLKCHLSEPVVNLWKTPEVS